MRRLAVLFVAVLVGCGTPVARHVGSASIKSASAPHPAVETADRCPHPRIALAGRCVTVRDYRAARRYLRALSIARYAAAVEAAAVGACGGDLPSCCTLAIESHGNPYAVEPGHQGAPSGDPGDPAHHASGKWQEMPSTWDGYAGYPWAAAAPAIVQNDKAREQVRTVGYSPWYGDGCYPGG